MKRVTKAYTYQTGFTDLVIGRVTFKSKHHFSKIFKNRKGGLTYFPGILTVRVGFKSIHATYKKKKLLHMEW